MPAQAAPVSPEPSKGLWFINSHVDIRVAGASNASGIAVMEMTLPHGDAPPLHVHHDEDEVFHLLEGRIRFQVGDTTTVAEAGDTLLAPRGVPHGFRVLSLQGARVLTVTRGGFEGMVRSVSRPAQTSGLPEPQELSEEMLASFAGTCAAAGIEFLGPPLD